MLVAGPNLAQEIQKRHFLRHVAQWQLGNQAEARTWHDQAVHWMDQNKPKDEVLLRFRAEAAELLCKKK